MCISISDADGARSSALCLHAFPMDSEGRVDVIEDREEITTPAGTFKCYILKQTMTSSLMGMTGLSTTAQSRYCG